MNQRTTNAVTRGRASSFRDTTLRAVLTCVGISTIFVVWEATVNLFAVPVYVLPSPSVIGKQVVVDAPLLWRHLQPTLVEAAGGFLIGNLGATALAGLFVYAPPTSRVLFPVAIALRTVPLVAVTPLLVVWLGNGYAPKIVIAALISFFPTLVNMTRGFSSVPPDHLELLHSLAASPWQTFRLVRLPTSLPYLFTALKISATSCFLGALVAEWIGADRGLGYLIVAATFEYRVARLWAAIAVSTGAAIVAFLLVVAAERIFVPWRQEVGE